MSHWVRSMLQQWGYYFTVADLTRAEILTPQERASELDRIYRRIRRANSIRKARGLPPLRAAYTPAGDLFDERLRNPQEFLFGGEAQEVEREPRHTPRRARKRFVDPRYAPVEPEQVSIFGEPEKWPASPIRVQKQYKGDYRSWLRYYRSLADSRLETDWQWWLAFGQPFDPIGVALKAGLKQALIERGLLGGGEQYPQLVYHTTERNPWGEW